ncbi:hypothetical protein [Chryseobacterium sediminis]|uniref:hypothetical protein n=1 Tax=Chryseobacterium sediminis TaxID=1679494 RepID=UPI00285DBA68|nr:hypothetical protein [Chryseobacterium sediminis]MDR6465338.1 hypothetical protein [Chryseobacterium sediminis]
MKKIHYILFCLMAMEGYAQVAISTNPSDHEPHPNAILDVKSTVPAKAVLLTSVPQISDAANPVGDNTFKGALVYSKNNASVYEHDGTRWRSTYDYVVETKPQYLAHFSRPSNVALSCTIPFLGTNCTVSNILIPISNSGPSDFQGTNINLSLTSNIITVNETALYRITYRSYAVLGSNSPVEARLKLQKASAATPTTFADIDSQSFTSDNARLGYNPVFNGSIVIQLNAGDKISLSGYMQYSPTVPVPGLSSSATFQNNGSNGTGEIIFEKVIL